MAREILITGSTGFVGRLLKTALEDRGYSVHGFSQQQGDIVSADLQYPQVDHVVHLAARTFVPESWRAPKPFYAVNVLGTLNVLEFCKRQQASLTLVSSYVYGRPEYLPIREDHPVQAVNPYSQSKIMAEELARFYEAYSGIEMTIVRPFNLYGPGHDRRFLIPTLIAQFLDPASDRVEVADLRPKRDYLHVRDLVRLLIEIAARGNRGVYNAGSGNSVSVAELGHLIQAVSGQNKPLVSRSEERANELMDVRADISKARRELDWAPSISLEDGLLELVESHRKCNPST